eukprot:4475565-Amphidinium_carterae.1
MRPNRDAEQQAVTQDYRAVRGDRSSSPRTGNPYAAVQGQPAIFRTQDAPQTQGGQTNDAITDMVTMAQQLITSIQTSGDGVTSETMTMQRAAQKRREVLPEHIASVPSQIMQDLRPSQRTRQWQLRRKLLRLPYLPPSL